MPAQSGFHTPHREFPYCSVFPLHPWGVPREASLLTDVICGGRSCWLCQRFPQAFKGCCASLPLVPDPWHCTLLLQHSCLCLCDLNRDLTASHMGGAWAPHCALVSALRKHQNTGTCLGLMALWEDFYIKKAVAKIAGFLIPVFLQVCFSSVCSELALEVGVTVHEVGYKHHMAACFSGKTLRDRIRGRVEEQDENILNPAIHERHSSHLLLGFLHKNGGFQGLSLGLSYHREPGYVRMGRKKQLRPCGCCRGELQATNYFPQYSWELIGTTQMGCTGENPWCFGMPEWLP